jgi:predicted metal-dependent hydrolase
VQLSPSRLLLCVRPGTNPEKRQAILAQFYRQEIKVAVPPLVAIWAPIMGVSLEKFYVQQMKTKWGSCNARTRTIRLNTELAKKPKHCLEYIIVHEMVHFFERHHGERFVSLMTRFMPQWRLHRDGLNRHPLAYADWKC